MKSCKDFDFRECRVTLLPVHIPCSFRAKQMTPQEIRQKLTDAAQAVNQARRIRDNTVCEVLADMPTVMDCRPRNISVSPDGSFRVSYRMPQERRVSRPLLSHVLTNELREELAMRYRATTLAVGD